MKLLLQLALAATLLSLSACVSSSIKPYTLKSCVVSDNELGSMGDPVTKVYGDQEITFCCKPCIKKFEKDPEKYLKKLREKTNQ